MPVGTKGSVKGMTVEELDLLSISMILGNTYHLANAPGSHLIEEMGGLHSFAGHDYMNNQRNILTDSGGFQMVSLCKFSTVTEEGVTFIHPSTQKKMLLKPEDSIKHQNRIGADVIMALDDVISSVSVDTKRFEEATHRTIRWLDRCIEAHDRPNDQNLFAIVQGGLDVELNGKRQVCLRAFKDRDKHIPGYAIGGLAGGETKDDFWKVVDFCCRALPDTKPRYLMGVGYPLDIVICTALGVDMYDCVYPTRTARFGVALVDGESPGTMRLKSRCFATDDKVIQEGCICMACKGGYTRARLNQMLKGNQKNNNHGQSDALAVQLLTHHNLAYMMTLTRKMRESIHRNDYGNFVRSFVMMQYPGKNSGSQGKAVPVWVKEAIESAGISTDGHCTDVGDDDKGSHHICIQMKEDFCTVTGQSNWCVEKMPCMDGHGKCPIGNWCVCQWAFARYIQMAGGCDAIVDLDCEGTNAAAVRAYKGEASDATIKAALECIERKCHISEGRALFN